jgi:cytochrome b6-f complex iron-sulfur subunit
MDDGTPTSAPQSKRDFLKIVLGTGLLGWLASVVYPLVAYLKPPALGEVEVTSVKVGPLASIAKGSGTIVRFGNKPVLLLRTAEGDLRAFSATCTHLDCTVQYRQEMEVIWCACHNGRYDLNGRNISGPPPRPLAEYRVVIQGEDVYLSQQT